ncbi:MAG: lamin tail domain-containing protein [Myxococcota bacterium]|nr:lamin tail domain-containing protein [Myxococcota bacterium]
MRLRGPVLFGGLFLFLGCSGSSEDGSFLPDWGPGQGIGAEDTGDNPWFPEDSDEPQDSDSGQAGDDTGDTEEPQDTGDPGPPVGSKDNPKVPEVGEVVITEIMVHPLESSDADGEWVELESTSEDWLTLSGCTLRDEGSDKSTLSASVSDGLRLKPGARVVLCANDDTWDNGNVDCEGRFDPSKFSMGSGADEVLLVCGSVGVDRVRYPSGWAAQGASMGVDGGKVSATKNDDLDNWCEQGGFLSNGDYGNPGSSNDWCF